MYVAGYKKTSFIRHGIGMIYFLKEIIFLRDQYTSLYLFYLLAYSPPTRC